MPKPKFIQWKVSAILSLVTALWSIMYFHYIWRLPDYTIIFRFFTVFVWPGVLFPSPSSISNFPAQSHVCVSKTKTITTKWRRILTKGRHRQEDRDDGQPLRRLRGGSTLRITPAATDQLRKGPWKVCHVFRIESTDSTLCLQNPGNSFFEDSLHTTYFWF